jgi:hypothetical protein
MRVKLAIVCSSRLLCERLKRLTEGDRDIVLVQIMTPPIDARDVVGLRSDVTLIDRETLFSIPGDLLGGGSLRAKLLLVEGRVKESPGTDREMIELIARSVLAGVIPADTKGRLVKKAIKMAASGELWLGHAVRNTPVRA